MKLTRNMTWYTQDTAFILKLTLRNREQTLVDAVLNKLDSLYQMAARHDLHAYQTLFVHIDALLHMTDQCRQKAAAYEAQIRDKVSGDISIAGEPRFKKQWTVANPAQHALLDLLGAFDQLMVAVHMARQVNVFEQRAAFFAERRAMSKAVLKVLQAINQVGLKRLTEQALNKDYLHAALSCQSLPAFSGKAYADLQAFLKVAQTA